jgi:hypothetical protein
MFLLQLATISPTQEMGMGILKSFAVFMCFPSVTDITVI